MSLNVSLFLFIEPQVATSQGGARGVGRKEPLCRQYDLGHKLSTSTLNARLDFFPISFCGKKNGLCLKHSSQECSNKHKGFLQLGERSVWKRAMEGPVLCFGSVLLLGRDPRRLAKSWEGVGESYLILLNTVRVSVKLLREGRGQGSPQAAHRHGCQAAGTGSSSQCSRHSRRVQRQWLNSPGS